MRRLGWSAWPGYLWFGVLVYLVLALLVLEPVRLALWLAPAHASRRARPRSRAAPAGVPGAGRRGGGGRRRGRPSPASASAPPSGRRTSCGSRSGCPGSTRRFTGFRVAVVSDIHLGPLLGRAHTERIVAVDQRGRTGPRRRRRRPRRRHRRAARRRRGAAAGPRRSRRARSSSPATTSTSSTARRPGFGNSSGSGCSCCATSTPASGAGAPRSISPASTIWPGGRGRIRPGLRPGVARRGPGDGRRSCSPTNPCRCAEAAAARRRSAAVRTHPRRADVAVPLRGPARAALPGRPVRPSAARSSTSPGAPGSGARRCGSVRRPDISVLTLRP